MTSFTEYLEAALDHALSTSDNGTDGGELEDVVALCAAGVATNHAGLTGQNFLRQFLWCVGSQQKNYDVRMSERPGGSFWAQQQAIFHDCDPGAVVAHARVIEASLEAERRYLSPAMVSATLSVARQIVDLGWPVFRDRFLPLPSDPQSQDLDDWLPLVWRLDELPRVGPTTGWYLLRNLLGAPVLKPDIHILAIAWHFFGDQPRPLQAMIARTREVWPQVCRRREAEARVLCPHLGVVDFILWWYRSQTGHPEDLAHEPPASYC
ncbi:hypothetical protein L6R50_19935 [Myxococcota bacterium]|nr:hypothetical protein [Myxococcota bacterium]